MYKNVIFQTLSFYITQVDIVLIWESIFCLCGLDDVIRHVICMLEKPEYLWNMMRY